MFSRLSLAGPLCALALPLAFAAPATAAVLETGVLSDLNADPATADYYFEWETSPTNRTVLELTLDRDDGVPAPAIFDHYDLVYWAGYYKPDPSASNEYFASCGGTFICNADTSASTPDVFRVRYTTYWGDKGDTIVSPISPIMINISAYFSDDVGNDPYAASYRILSVPEPAAWGLMLLGFSAVGGVLRRRRALASA